MTEASHKKIVLTAGGSGGHVFPAEALARELSAKGAEISFITDRRGNTFSGKFPQLKEYRIFAGAYAGKPALAKLQALFLMGIGILQSLRILRRIKPDAVVGFGGYASFPACYAAGILKIPLILHEQNSVLGGANRILAKKCTLIATTFPNVGRIPAGINSVHTGVPVRPAILALRSQPYPAVEPPFNILIFGGSQGAKILSRVVPEALKLLPAEMKNKLSIAQQCRAADLPDVEKAYDNSGISPELAPFFSDIAERMGRAHLVICRSGASTVCELAVAGRPAILVPILHSADAHQLGNAKFMTDHNAAFLCEEPDFTPQWLSNKILELFNHPKMLITASENAQSIGTPDAVHTLAEAVLKTAKA